MSEAADRWLKVPVVSAGPCLSKVQGGEKCGHQTVRVQGLKPAHGAIFDGGAATFTICHICDGIAATPPGTRGSIW